MLHNQRESLDDLPFTAPPPPPYARAPPPGHRLTQPYPPPSTADRLLGNSTSHDDCLSPGESPKYSGRKRTDSRRAILLVMTFANLLLAFILIVLGFAGPDYPGHSGTVDKSYFHTAGVCFPNLETGQIQKGGQVGGGSTCRVGYSKYVEVMPGPPCWMSRMVEFHL